MDRVLEWPRVQAAKIGEDEGVGKPPGSLPGAPARIQASETFARVTSSLPAPARTPLAVPLAPAGPALGPWDVRRSTPTDAKKLDNTQDNIPRDARRDTPGCLGTGLGSC